MTKARSLKQLLANGTVTALIEQAHRLQAIDILLPACIPGELVAHVRTANWRNDRLVLQTDSAAWATRLRYLLPQLQRCLQQHPQLAELQQIDLRVAPQERPANPAPQPACLSTSSAHIIDTGAETIADPALRAALKRLARRGKRR